MKKFIMSDAARKGLLQTGLLLLACLTFSTASEADIDIPSTPLFLTSVGVRPNIVMTFDDSLSMQLGWVPESVTSDQSTIDGPRFKAASVNGLYYNPNLVYPVPTRGGDLTYSTSFTSAYFNGFDTSKGTVDLSSSYKVVGQAITSDRYSNCSGTVTTNTSYFGCELVKHPATITPTTHTATGCTVTYTHTSYRRRRTRDQITASGNSACSSIFAGILAGTRVTIGASTFTVSRRTQSSSTVIVRETVTSGTTTGATITWISTNSSGGGTSGTAAYYYLYYGDKPGATRPSGCNDSETNNSCYVKSVVGQTTGADADITPGTPAQQKQNFANWYSFYRTRALAVMSSAMSAVAGLDDNSVRLGWQTINRCTMFGVNCKGYDNANRENRLKPLDASRKSTFSNWLQRFDLTGATPLRSAVERVGEYFSTDGRNSPYAEDPYVSEGTEYACRKNFHMLFTDGLWNSDSGYTTPGSNANPDSTSTTGLPDGETYTPQAPYQDVNVSTTDSYTNANGVADTAFHYWATDLNSSIDNQVAAYVTDLSGTAEDQYWNAKNDPATWQHMVTYAIGLGLSSSLTADCLYDPDDLTPDPNNPDPGCPVWGGNTYAGDFSGLAAGELNWPKINTSPSFGHEPDGQVYDLWHAAINSRGQFYSAENPADLVEAFKDVMDTVNTIADAGGGAGLSSSTTQISEGGSVVYEAKFNADWSGRLLAYPITTSFSFGTPYWDAAEKMPSPDARHIYTTNSAAEAFTTCADDLADALDKDPSGHFDGLCSKRLNWLRGDGKVTNAVPGSYDAGTQMVPVSFTITGFGTGHGFQSGDSVTISDVTVSDDPPPVLSYNGTFTVLASPAPTETTFSVAIPSAPTGPGTYQSGGRARYTEFRDRSFSTLGDIIDSAPVYVFEEDFGYGGGSSAVSGSASYAAFVTGKSTRPEMIYVGANDGMLHGFRADVGDAQSGVEQFAYVPHGVYSNGVDAHGVYHGLSVLTDPTYVHQYYVDGPLSVSDAYDGSGWATYLVGSLGAGGKSIFALDISDPTNFSASDVKWEFADSADLGLTFSRPQIEAITASQWGVIFGNGYNSANDRAYLFVVDLADGTRVAKIATSSDPNNGLATPHLYDSDGNMIIDVAYAGDLQGNLWKFVNAAGTWTLGNGNQPLFTARNDDNDVQSITSEPAVAAHPDGGVLIYFGTGRYLTTDDLTNDEQQSFYAIWDKGAGNQATVTRDDLEGYSILSEESAEGYTVRTTSQGTVDWSTQWGWYLDLPDTPGVPSERIIATPLVMQFADDSVPDRVLFVTNTPAADPCSRGGTTWLMELDLVTGGRTLTPVFDLTGEGDFTDEDTVRSHGENVTVSGHKLPDEYGLAGTPLLLEDRHGDIVKLFSGSTGESGTAGGPLQRGEHHPIWERIYWRQIF